MIYLFVYRLDLTCQWRNCGHVEEFDSSSFIRHVQFHGFHTKLKYLGTKTTEYNQSSIPKCQKSSENRNIIPDLPVAFRCSWGDCKVKSMILNSMLIYLSNTNYFLTTNRI